MTLNDNELQSILKDIRRECGSPYLKIKSEEVERLALACGDNSERLRRCIKRRMCGDPIEYILGLEKFRGYTFFVDRRTYITDSETTFLVDAVIAYAKTLLSSLSRPVTILEMGVGCGSLAISVKKVLQETVLVRGIDIDSAALELAEKNRAFHQVDLELIESDLLRSYPYSTAPDILFGDPPWGDETSIYDPDRPWEHYQAMPPMAVSPVGGVIQIHEQILKSVQEKQWFSHIFLNTGTLDETYLGQMGVWVEQYEILRPKPAISIFHGWGWKASR
ncbi:methyltransferase [bacterium]|nr:methyltransferase [bacterium]